MLAKKGFTLLEIIIALFIFSIVSIIVVSALHNVLSTQSASAKKAERLSQLQIALLMLSRDMEQVINRPVTNASGAPEGFIGALHSVTFTRAGLENPFGQLQRSTLQRIRYQLNNGKLQRLTWGPLDQTAAAKPDTKFLLDSVTDLQFEYLDKNRNFQKIWPPPDQPRAILPLAIGVSLTIN